MFFPGEDPLAPPPTDGGDALATVFLVLSHIGLAPLVVFLLLDGLGYLGASVLGVFFFSNVYHLCRGEAHCFGLPPSAARLLDHITANHVPVALALTAMGYDRGAGAPAVARTLMPFVVAFAELRHPYQPQALIIIVTVLLLVAADRYLRVGALRVPDASRYDLVPLGIGVVITAAGLVCFYVPESGYPVAHSLWHLLLTAGIFFVALGITRGYTRFTVRFCTHCRHIE